MLFYNAGKLFPALLLFTSSLFRNILCGHCKRFHSTIKIIIMESNSRTGQQNFTSQEDANQRQQGSAQNEEDHLASFNAQRSKKGLNQGNSNDRQSAAGFGGDANEEQDNGGAEDEDNQSSSSFDQGGNNFRGSQGGGYNYAGNQNGYQGDQDYENGRTYSGRMSGDVNSEQENLSRERGYDDNAQNGRRGFENGNTGQGETPYEDERDRFGKDEKRQ